MGTMVPLAAVKTLYNQHQVQNQCHCGAVMVTIVDVIGLVNYRGVSHLSIFPSFLLDQTNGISQTQHNHDLPKIHEYCR